MTQGDFETYIRKAQRTLSAARLLLGSGDTEGACNRASYAMFNAAHAALIGVQAPAPVAGSEPTRA